LRRELRRRAGPGTAASVLAQQEVVADALAEALAKTTDEQLPLPGGEGEWNVAHAIVIKRTVRLKAH
jgi:hypothetical protein